MLFYAWNPLLLHELVGNAHNDAAVAALALLGFYLLSPILVDSCRTGGAAGEACDPQTPAHALKGSFAPVRGLAAIPCLTLAALIKPVVLLWVPLIAFWLLMQGRDWTARACRALVIAGLVAVPAVVAYAPFWVGSTTFRGVLVQSDIHGNSLPNLLIQAVWSLWPAAGDQIVAGVKWLAVSVVAPFYLIQLWVARKRPVRASFDVVLFYLLFVSFQFWPWYLTWLMVPAALLSDPLRQRLAIALCAMAPLLYFPFGWQWARSDLPGWGMALLSSLPLLGFCVWLGVRAWLRWGRRSR
jgi:hypothetical protein